jgi:hypothetical protein
MTCQTGAGLFNHQAAPRGGDEFRVPNWWMGVEVETALLEGDSLGHEEKDIVSALTLGTVRELPRWRWLETGLGAAVTFYAVPDRLQSSYGLRPVSFQVFLRLRPAAGAMGRMWNMHMIKPMHPVALDPHAGHHMP